MLRPLLMATALALPAGAASPPPFPLAEPQVQSLLQSFSSAAYRTGFLRLGDYRDFDHGHLLFDAEGRPRAVLYHTQELAAFPGSGVAPVDLDSRNWLQWLDTGAVEKADRYRRSSYPDTPFWRMFQRVELPAYLAHRTITHLMLDPALLGFEIASARQWVFAERGCEPEAMTVRLPESEPVCLRLIGR